MFKSQNIIQLKSLYGPWKCVFFSVSQSHWRLLHTMITKWSSCSSRSRINCTFIQHFMPTSSSIYLFAAMECWTWNIESHTWLGLCSILFVWTVIQSCHQVLVILQVTPTCSPVPDLVCLCTWNKFQFTNANIKGGSSKLLSCLCLFLARLHQICNTAEERLYTKVWIKRKNAKIYLFGICHGVTLRRNCLSMIRSKSVDQMMEHVMERHYHFDLTYITERIISVFFLPDLEEQQYCRNLQEVASMLKSKHQDKFLVSGNAEDTQDWGLPKLKHIFSTFCKSHCPYHVAIFTIKHITNFVAYIWKRFFSFLSFLPSF